MFIHAAGISGPATDQTYALAVEASDLDKLHHKLDYFSIPHICFYEPDEPWNGELLSIGIYPCPYGLIKPVVKSLKLAFSIRESRMFESNS